MFAPDAFVCPSCGLRSAQPGACPLDAHGLEPTDDPLLGTNVASYRLTRLLGRGGMGRVYLARNPEIGSHVAVKVLAEDCAHKPELVERFFAEARAVNLIRNEHIINILDLCRLPNGRPAIIMEFVDGRTLREVIDHGVPALGGIVNAITEVLVALDAAHAAGVIHRDLKPENIMITSAGRVKLLDFGIAKLAHGVGTRTATGTSVGTPHYMAPEQITRGPVDARTDLYAVGIVLFEAMTGQRPFNGTSDFELMQAHIEGARPSPRALRDAIPPAVDAVIVRSIDATPEHRFPSARAMARALRDAATALPAEEWRALGGSPWSSSASGSSTGFRPPAPDVRVHHPRDDGGDQRSSRETSPTVVEPRANRPQPRNQRSPEPQTTAVVKGMGRRSHARVWWVAGIAIAALGVAGGLAFRGGSPDAARVATAPAAVGGTRADPTSRPRAEPLPGDLTHFDATAYLPHAAALVAAQAPDAELSSISADVAVDGTSDLSALSRATVVYAFRSPARSAAQTPRAAQGLTPGLGCSISVLLYRGTATIVSRNDQGCSQHLIGLPQCALTEVMKHAQRSGMTETDVAFVAFKLGPRNQPSWLITSSAHPDWKLSDVPDDCAGGRPTVPIAPSARRDRAFDSARGTGPNPY